MAFSFTRLGSHTKASYVSTTPPELMSTPKRAPAPSGMECFCRSLFRISVASKPALSHSCRGITSSACTHQRPASVVLDVRAHSREGAWPRAARVLHETVPADLHVDRASAGHDAAVRQCAPDNLDRVMERPLRLFDELCAAGQRVLSGIDERMRRCSACDADGRKARCVVAAYLLGPSAQHDRG
eukprot:scaffold152_cov383-Prasinococcus_capsulatus_cf.AAC.11